ncbi:MAG: hypothetical protein ACKOBJ_07900 [Actinomycetota bacterium]
MLGESEGGGLGMADRGGGAVDHDLGRSLLSTPRLERNLQGYWGNRGELEEADPVDFAKDNEFIDSKKETASRALRAGMGAGEAAEKYRSRFASIRKRHFGGFLNFKNWGWVRRMRERKLRAQLGAEFGAPAPAPDLGRAPIGPVPSHRTAVPQKSALKVRGGRQHTGATLLPESAEANEQVEQAVETESEAGAPFAHGGAHYKKLDAKHDGKKARLLGLPESSNPLLTGQLLFGGPSASVPAGPVEGEDALKTYASAMESSNQAEQKRQAAASIQTHTDQGDLAAPLFKKKKYAARSNFWNGYWGAEQTNAKPTSRARTGKGVQFSEPDAKDLMDKSDPNRKFAKKDAVHIAGRAERKSALSKRYAEFHAANPGYAEEFESHGRERHAQEPVMQFPDNDSLRHSGDGAEAVHPGLIEEEKDAHYWDR